MFRLKHLVAVIAATTLALVGFGCSSSAEFKKAASPIASIVVSDMNAYTAAMPDGNNKITQVIVTKKFDTAIASADKATAFSAWDTEGLKGFYVGHLRADPKYATGIGADVLDMKLKNVDVLDYVFESATPK